MNLNEDDETRSETTSNRLDGRQQRPAGGAAHDGRTKVRSIYDDTAPPPPPPRLKAAGTGRPPGTSGAPRAGFPRMGLWIGGGILAAALLVAAVGILSHAVGSRGSTQDDETRSAQKEQADFKAWRGSLQVLEGQGRSAGNLGLPQAETKTPFGWWQRKTSLPNEAAVRGALMRRLPANFKVVALQPVQMEKTDSGVRTVYQVTLKCGSAECLVPVGNIKLTGDTPRGADRFARYLVAAPDLPAGRMFLTDEKRVLLREGETVQFAWTVREAARTDGVWRVLDAEPLPFQRDAGFEYRLADATPGAAFALPRSAEEVDSLASQQDRRLREFRERFARIREQVDAYRSDRMASVPGTPRKDTTKFGGSGSGEPTKTAARVGGGAATGAAIGAMAGGGEGAGWGALGGLVAGGIYDAVSKSNDKKKFEEAKERDYQERKADRASALRSAERDVAAYEKKLVSDYESELKEEARRQESKLRLAAGL